MSGGLKEDWAEVVEDALSKLVPTYDRMNRVMSFGMDIKWRVRGISVAFKGTETVLDAGCGPGVMTEVWSAMHPTSKPIMLDALREMLEASSARVGDKCSGSVRGVFEALPFKDSCFDGVMMGFSFRDARDMRAALAELSRVTKTGGALLIVDIAKPDNPLMRWLIGIYWMLIVPLAAIFFAGSRWRHYRVLYTTYKRLPKNSDLRTLIGQYYADVWVETHMSGGQIILVARNPKH
jgi:demethylmenaquinone methyltransferase/2-methoxy-6-polyprenyl-1,4-benzoquinol methylase